MIKENTGLRAVFYARVSTQEEHQLRALPKQVDECRDVINTKNWKLIDEYVDEGKSGTVIKRRDEYQRLLEDMEKDKFDIVVVKDQDRLQRNTRDWYNFIDCLVQNKLKLYFYLDNTYYSPDNALITGIKAIMAEEYSRNLSKKMVNSNHRRIEKAKAGEPVSAMGNGQTYGYKIVSDKWVVDEEQREVVGKMYELYSELHSIRKVRDALNKQGYRNQRGSYFTEEVVGRVIKNVMHKGWVILNRHHRDFETKQIIEKPEEEWVIVKDDHEPIVSEAVWDAVNEEIQSHKNRGNSKGKGRGKRMGTEILSGKMFCAHCGRVLWKHPSNGYVGWYCSGKLGKGDIACEHPAIITGININKYLVTLADRLLDYSTIEYSKALLKRRSIQWLKDLKDSLSTPNNNENIKAEIEKLEGKKAKLLDAYTDELISKEEFKNKRIEIANQISAKEALLVPKDEHPDIKAIEDTIKNIDNEIDMLFENEAMMEENKVKFLMEHIKKIIVCENKDVCVILDKVAGAVLLIDGGKAEISIELVSEDEENYVFDRESMPFPNGRICNERFSKKSRTGGFV